MIRRTLLAALTLVVVASGLARAQHQEPVQHVANQRSLSSSAFAAWRAEHGPGWVIDVDPHSGFASFFGGGRAWPQGRPVQEAELVGLARQALIESAALSGLDESSLRLVRTKFIPLGLIGSSDKWSVRFSQEHAALPVFGAHVNVLLDMQGATLSVQSSGLTDLEQVTSAPRLSADQARVQAARSFEAELGLTPTALGEARLGVGWTLVDGRRRARLAWELEARWSWPATRPEGRRYWIDALTGESLRSQATVHDLDVGGSVSGFMSPGIAPDTGSNPPVSVPLKDLRIKSAAGDVFTDAAGNFNIAGATGPLQVTAEFVGPWAHVDNDTGPEEILIPILSGSGNALVLNAAPGPTVTSQANAFVAIGQLRDWIRAVDPTDDTADFQAYARVNIASACNAYFDGFSVNFFATGTSGSVTCENTGYSTVVAHEMGHWLNVLYSTGNGDDGMGEGNADVFAMYLYDTPLVGDGFFGPGTLIRNGINNTMFCGDCCPGCHGGQVHKEGEVWMGAAWHVRDRLNLSNGNALGDLIADGLFSGWMNAYSQTQIRSVIELQWLVLDDDNGNLDDGTPHYGDIDPGFRDQGFPGFDLPAVLFSDVTLLGDTLNESGPYPLSATVVPQTSPGINSVTLSFRVNDGAWINFGMVPFGGDLYQVDIPGQSSIAFVEYYLSAQDANSVVVQFPEGGANDPIRFVVGAVNVLFFDDFEGADDNGWSHGSFGDTTNSHDDFQRGAPAHRAGDPAQAFSGVNVWGNDLGQGVWNGAYQNNQHNWLRTPPIDCSQATNTQLRFQQWLSVDSVIFDTARVRVNGNEIFVNDAGLPTQEDGWSFLTYDVSAFADGQPAVEVEFSLQSDSSSTFGGWNIDDVELRYLSPSPTSVGTAYCFGDGSGAACPCNNGGSATEGCLNSSGAGAVLSGLGSTNVQADDLVLHGERLLPTQPALLFVGLNAVQSGNGAVFGDGLRCAGGSIVRLGVQAPDALGFASWGPGLRTAGAWNSGDTRRFQCWYRDPSGGPCATGFNLSNGLEVNF